MNGLNRESFKSLLRFSLRFLYITVKEVAKEKKKEENNTSHCTKNSISLASLVINESQFNCPRKRLTSNW